MELQTVLVPHLGLRLGAQGAVPPARARLVPLLRPPPILAHVHQRPGGDGAQTRYRRTTECGGRRKETRDETGLLALSINEASRKHHFPQRFLRRLGDADWDVASREGALRPLHARLASSGPAGDQVHPIVHVMQDLSVLLAAARMLDEPLYVFDDDARDHFNQLAISSEE